MSDIYLETGGMPVQPMETCVMVGNGPSVLQAKMGRVIDSFDQIVRFNQYKIKGFEDHVGTRTTLYSTFGRGMTPLDEQRPNRIIYVHGGNGNPAWKPEELWRVPLSFFWSLTKDWESKDNKEKTLPSSGFTVASWLFANGVQRIHLAGFDHFAKHESSKQHHYWVSQSFKTPKEHRGPCEAESFAEWVRQGKVFYLT